VPVSGHFAGHEVCGKDGEWINGPTAAVQYELRNDQSFHPTAVGQAEYARCVNAVFLSAGRACKPLTF